MNCTSKFVCAVFGAALLLTGCKGKDGDPGPAGPSGQNLTGNLLGYVTPIDDNGGPLAKSGVTVSIDGATPAVTTLTDADGKYTFANVRSGTYNLTYTKTGAATFRRFGVGHVGGDQPTYLGNVSLTQVSTIAVSSFAASTTAGSSNVTFNLTLTSPTPASTFRFAVFASSTPTVSLSTGVLLFTSSAALTTPTSSVSTSIPIGRATLTNAGFATGSTVYLAAVGSTAALSSYSDPATGRVVYPAMNPTVSPVTSIVVP